jgi:cold-inducible RNA-binding protein
MSTRIYVGNLPYSATNDQLAELFSQYGEVAEATVVMDRGTGQSKGFGFIEMTTDEAARNAIAGLNGTMLGGRALRVNEAQPRTDRSSGGYDDRSRGPRW